MSEFLRYTVFGLAFASIYFVAASGLVMGVRSATSTPEALAETTNQ